MCETARDSLLEPTVIKDLLALAGSTDPMVCYGLALSFYNATIKLKVDQDEEREALQVLGGTAMCQCYLLPLHKSSSGIAYAICYRYPSRAEGLGSRV
eukprot:1232865-Rhodomonas_salina.1